MMNFYEIIGFCAALFTTLAFLPQVIKSVRLKKTRDLAYGLLVLQSTGNFLWAIYGLLSHLRPVIIANIITFSLVFFLLIFKLALEKFSKPNCSSFNEPMILKK